MDIDLSGAYYIRKLFDIGGVFSSVDGHSEFLDWDNCKIVHKTPREDCIILHLKRETDGMEGKSFVKVKPEFINRKDLLNKFFINKEIMNYTLNQISDIQMTV